MNIKRCINNENQNEKRWTHLDFQSVAAQDKLKDTCYNCKDEFRSAGYLQRNLQLAAARKQRGRPFLCKNVLVLPWIWEIHMIQGRGTMMQNSNAVAFCHFDLFCIGTFDVCILFAMFAVFECFFSRHTLTYPKPRRGGIKPQEDVGHNRKTGRAWPS